MGKLSQLNMHAAQSNINKEVEVVENRNGGHWPLGNESKQKRGKNVSASYPSADKVISCLSFWYFCIFWGQGERLGMEEILFGLLSNSDAVFVWIWCRYGS